MLSLRILTAAIGVPILLGLFAYGHRDLVASVFAVCLVISIIEATQILLPALLEKLASLNVGHQDTQPEKIKTVVRQQSWLNSIVGLVFFTAGVLEYKSHIFLMLALILLWLFALLRSGSIANSVAFYCTSSIAVIYGSLLWVVAWEIFKLEQGYSLVVWLLAVVFCNDAGAYFVGLKFGKHKLAPEISPKKTIEGLFGGLLCSIIASLVINFVFSRSIASEVFLIFAAVFVALAGVVGDLFESSLKRFAHIKDSGRIFPGHGGMLDRIDALIFAAPVLWFLLLFR